MTYGKRVAATSGCLLAATIATAAGGEFDRLEGEALARAARSEAAKPVASLRLNDLDALPAALGDTRAAFLIVKTGQGNYARVLASQALRKPADGQAEAIPVLVLERFDTFEPGRSGSRLAKGAGAILFEGFQIDLDTGLIVPAGQGGDLELGKDASGPVLRPVGKAELITLTKPLPAAAAAPGPSPGKAVVPGDFAGRYTLHADGRWSGLLELSVAADRTITGRFRSEANGTSYPVAGEVSAETPQKATFTVKFPRTEQLYEAFLWTEGKNALAGSFKMLERDYGFVAVREGSRLAEGP
jgi:hypothetical protein